MLKILTLIKRWWKCHRWVDVRDNYIIPHKLEVFWLNEDEIKKAKAFKEQHKATFYQYCFTPGPIGVCTRIKCRDKEEECEEDITDYNAW